MSLLHLPEMLLIDIYGHLGPKTLARLGCISRALASTEVAEVVWNTYLKGELLKSAKEAWRDPCLRKEEWLFVDSAGRSFSRALWNESLLKTGKAGACVLRDPIVAELVVSGLTSVNHVLAIKDLITRGPAPPRGGGHGSATSRNTTRPSTSHTPGGPLSTSTTVVAATSFYAHRDTRLRELIEISGLHIHWTVVAAMNRILRDPRAATLIRETPMRLYTILALSDEDLTFLSTLRQFMNWEAMQRWCRAQTRDASSDERGIQELLHLPSRIKQRLDEPRRRALLQSHKGRTMIAPLEVLTLSETTLKMLMVLQEKRASSPGEIDLLSHAMVRRLIRLPVRLQEAVACGEISAEEASRLSATGAVEAVTAVQLQELSRFRNFSMQGPGKGLRFASKKGKPSMPARVLGQREGVLQCTQGKRKATGAMVRRKGAQTLEGTLFGKMSGDKIRGASVSALMRGRNKRGALAMMLGRKEALCSQGAPKKSQPKGAPKKSQPKGAQKSQSQGTSKNQPGKR